MMYSQDTIHNNERIDNLIEEFEPKDDDELQVQSTKSESVIESSMKEESSKRSRWISLKLISEFKHLILSNKFSSLCRKTHTH